jgi:fatty acid desaturase
VSKKNETEKKKDKNTAASPVESPSHLKMAAYFVIAVHRWITEKGKDEQMSLEKRQLWRIRGKYYDLSKFVDTHPGGKEWIEYTKGTDCTDLFEVHHIDINKANQLLDKYEVNHVKDSQPSEPRFTFDQGGLYYELRETVRKILGKNIGPTDEMIKITWLLLGAFAFFFYLTATTQSTFYAVCCGVVLNGIWGVGHSLIHQKDTNLRYIFNLTITPSAEWRVSHCISHHTYPNSKLDLEVSFLYPFLQFYSSSQRSSLYQATILFFCAFLFPLAPVIGFVKNMVLMIIPLQGFQRRLEFLIPVGEIVLLYLCIGSISEALRLFFVMQAVFALILVGTSFSVHHSEYTWHDGDTTLQDNDFARHIFNTTSDHSISSPLLWSLVAFSGLNDHIIHHLFPTVDRSNYPKIRGELQKVCKKYGISWKDSEFLDLHRGIFVKLQQNGTRWAVAN